MGVVCRGFAKSDCSPTMIVFEVPSVTPVSRTPSFAVMRSPSTPPSEIGPLTADVSVEGCRLEPRMQVYVGSYALYCAVLMTFHSGSELDGHRVIGNVIPS